MPYTVRKVESLQEVVRYVDVRCDSCNTPLQPEGPVGEEGWTHLQARDALHVSLFGGYGELVDLMDEADHRDATALICKDCARRMAEAFPFVEDILFRHMNLNVGHVCVDGSRVWVAQPECEVDPDRHGWRKIWAVVPHEQSRGNLVAHAVFDSQEEAEAYVASHPEVSIKVQESLVGHLEYYQISPLQG